MTGSVRVVGVAAAILMLCVVPSFSQHGAPPRPAEKPPEYGCKLLDLATSPYAVQDGDRIDQFLLKYRCEAKTRPVDVEIRNDRAAGAEPELVKIATDVILEKGEHTLRLTGGGLAQGGRYVTSLKASVPQGKKEIMRRVDPASCQGWELKYEGKHLRAGRCDLSLHTAPGVFRTGERIDAFLLGSNCEAAHRMKDIRISWEPPSGGAPQLVKIATDVLMPSGKNVMRLAGGGVGREGHYVLQIEDVTTGAMYKTNCTAWTLGGR